MKTSRLIFIVFLTVFVLQFGKAQVIDKKFTTNSVTFLYDYAPNNTVTGNQVNASKSNIYSQGFNAATVPAGWSVVDVLGTSGDVTFVTTSAYPSGYVPTEGTHMARFNSYDANAGNNVRLAQTTPISTLGYTTVKVNFDWLIDAAYSGNRDSVYVQWSTDGTNWNTGDGVGRYSTTSAWSAKSVTLPTGASNQTNLYIGFLFVSKYGNNCHLDNVVITADPLIANDLSITSWLAPLTGTDTSLTDTIKVTVTNNGTANASNFNISYSTNGGTSFTTQLITGTITAGSSANYTFTATANMSIYTTYNCIAAVSLSGDQNTTNDTLDYTLTKSQPTVSVNCSPQLLPLWTGTVEPGLILDSSLVNVASADSSTGWMRFDISSIPDNAVIQSVELHAYISNDNYAYFKVMSLEKDPLISAPDTIFDDTRNGNTYYTYTTNFPNPGWFVGMLGTSAATDLTSKLSANWFGVGLYEYESTAGYFLTYDGWEETNKPYIVVNYMLPLNNDVAALEFTSPVTGYNPSNQVSLKIKNQGTDPVTEVPISYVFFNTTVTETTPAGLILNYNDEYTYTFSQTIDVTDPINYILTGYVNNPGDLKPLNDQITYSFQKWQPFYPLKVNFNISAITGGYGPEYMNGGYYVSRFNTNSISVLNNQGTLDTNITTTPISGFRDLARDTNFLYGGVNTANLYKLNVVNDTAFVIDTLVTATIVRGTTYDPINDGIWISNWNSGTEDFLLVDKNTGTTIQTVINPYPNVFAVGGLAYDYWTPGGPYLVGISQHASSNQLVWIKIADGTVLVDHAVTQDIPEIIGSLSGGAFESKEAFPGSVILGGVSQSARLFAYQIASTAIDTFTIPGQINSVIDATTHEIHVDFLHNAILTGLIPVFSLDDYHNLSQASINGVQQLSGVNSVNLADGDTLIYHVVRKNFNNNDSIYTDWKVIINVLDTPEVKSTGASNISFIDAELNGSILPNFVQFTDAYFEYGTSIPYSSVISPADTTASGSLLKTFAANLTGLTSNTTYHYRFVGMDGSTPVYGNDTTFTTLQYELLVSPQTQSVTELAGSVDYYVTCNTDWTAISDQIWCTVTPSGTGNDTITADYADNLLNVSRTAQIIVTAGTLSDTVTLVQDELVGIYSANEQDINIYPNPSNGLFILEMNGVFDIQVINILGETVFSDRVRDSYLLDLTNQSVGIYILRMKSSEQEFNNYLLIK